MKTILTLILCICLFSCDITKEAFKSKNDIESEETIKTETYRKGDTVTYQVPRIKYKDTVITTVSTQGTILRNYYNRDGEIYKNDCRSAEIKELREEMRRINDQSKVKDKAKEENFDNSFILYIVIGLVVIVIFGMFILAKRLPNLK